ncbi:N-acetylmuramoyl-L-alanine amidase [Sporomusaceae bacterium FL31]|nr:N-acetylmuramoyl-L-alanine amidase [Sporomusaceae bacterium FL31]GCE35403.1 N-acetylmuramoyl-L-alanine amidase [Sporomusaceae bacterium]
MIRKKAVVLFLLLIFIIPQIVWAGLPDGIPDSIPDASAKLSVLKFDNQPIQPASALKVEMTKANFALHTDAVTGIQKLRLVVDVTGPVQASAVMSDTAQEPQLIVKVNGASIGKMDESLDLDGNIAKTVNFTRIDDSSSQLMIKLPAALEDTDYRVFTLPSDADAGRPYRVVVDMNKPGLMPNSTPVKLDKRPVQPSPAKKAEMTKASFAIHTDAVTGAQKLRLVVDVTGQVQTSSSIVTAPEPRLMVNIQGASVGRLKQILALDGNIADQVKFSRIDDTNSQLIIDLPGMLEDNDYRVFTLPNDVKANRPNRVVVDINKPVAPVVFNFAPGLKGKVIVLDPGHGGSDPGAIGLNNITEKAVTLPIAQKVKALLEKAGAKVVMTRQDDRDVFGAGASAVEELSARTNVANKIKADLFLSIHANAFSNRSVGGTSTHYYLKSRYDRLLAECLQSSVVAADGLTDRGVQAANFYVVKRTLMPAALIEVAFISNPDEEKLLNTPQFQQQLAQGIVTGLDSFFLQAAKIGGAK